MAWLLDFLKAIELERASFVGNSQGGAISLHLAFKNPDRVTKLVLNDSGALGSDFSKKILFNQILFNIFPSSNTANGFIKYLVNHPHKIDNSYSMYLADVTKMPGGKRVFWSGKSKPISQMSEEHLKQISKQTLIIWEENDLFFPVNHGKNAEKIMPNAELVIIQDSGHLPYLDQPEIFNKTLIEFLKR